MFENFTLDKLLILLETKLGFALAGLFGGIVAQSRKKQIHFFRSAIEVMSGALCAGYLTPLFHFENKLEHSLAFVIGMMSMRIVDYILKIDISMIIEKFKVK